MGEILHKIPYDEAGNQLSFITDASTVFVGDLTLEQYLESLKGKLQGSQGRDGATIDPFEVGYTNVTNEQNDLSFVKTIQNWSTTPPNLTKDRPHLWKRTKVVIRTNGVADTSYEYQYCGSQGTPGIDGEWREWIFRIDLETPQIEATLQKQLDDCSSDPNFKNNDYIPTGWSDDMMEEENDGEVQWCASRDKIAGVWQPFKNLHIFGRKPKDGTTSNNIYTIAAEIDETLWEKDKKVLLEKLVYNEGEVYGFPKNTNYLWLDDVPNADATQVIYQATCYFTGNTCISIDSPIRITGPEGPGSDGNGLEFAYYLSKTRDAQIPVISGSETHFISSGGWFDTAAECPISDIYPYQFVSQRQGQYTDANNWYWAYKGHKYGKSSTDPTVKSVSEAPAGWNYGWSDPMLWSSWGQDGVDGDGVQYVFLRLTQEEFDWVTKYGWELSNETFAPPSRPSYPSGSGRPEDIENITYPDPRPEGIKEETSEPETRKLVDLGLPSGTLWSNVNGIPDVPIKNSDIGGFFAIGELHSYENALGSKKFVPSDYLDDFYASHSDWQQMSKLEDCGGGMDPFREYVSGGSKFGSLWPREYDIAHHVLGDGYRIPTKDQWLELFDLPKEWILMNDMPGYKFTGYNGNTIFLPAYGCARDGFQNSSGSAGLYWSSSPAEAYSAEYFGHMCFYNGGYGFSNNQRYHGRPFRVVYNEEFVNELDEFVLPTPEGGTKPPEKDPEEFRWLELSPSTQTVTYNQKTANVIAKVYFIDKDYNLNTLIEKPFTIQLDFNLTGTPKTITKSISVTYDGETYTETAQIIQNPADAKASFIVYGRDAQGDLIIRAQFTTEQLGDGDNITQNIGQGQKIEMIIAPKDSELKYSIYKEGVVDDANWRSESEDEDIFVKLYPKNFDINSKYSIRLESNSTENPSNPSTPEQPDTPDISDTPVQEDPVFYINDTPYTVDEESVEQEFKGNTVIQITIPDTVSHELLWYDVGTSQWTAISKYAWNISNDGSNTIYAPIPLVYTENDTLKLIVTKK